MGFQTVPVIMTSGRNQDARADLRILTNRDGTVTKDSTEGIDRRASAMACSIAVPALAPGSLCR
jgi:hypothetical protein